MTTILIPLGLGFIMFTVGLGLALADFRAVLHRPRGVALGLVGQLVLMPLAAVVVAWSFALAPLAALGLVLVACVPGGVTSNFLTVLARGDAALSVTLTACATTLSVATVPIVLMVAQATFDPAGLVLPAQLPIARTAQVVLAISALPMALGMALRAMAPLLALELLVPARKAATAVFAVIVIGAFAGDWAVVEANGPSLGPAVVTFNLVAVGLGLGLGWLARLDAQATLTLAIECGLQNVALALFLGGGVLGEPALMVPAILYVLAMNASALALVALGRRPALVAVGRR